MNVHISTNIHLYTYIKDPCDNDIHTLKNGVKIGLILHITVVVDIFLIFYDDKNTDSK